MALIVQTLPVVADANSYVSVADFRAYHLLRGSDTSAFLDAAVEGALVRATQYLDVRFTFVGYRTTADQTTEWPRTSAYNDRSDLVTGIPTAVKGATCEYALRALASTSLLPDPAVDARGQRVRMIREKLDVIETEIEYAPGGETMLPSYPMADRMLTARGLVVTSGSGGIRVGSLGRA